MLTYRQQSERDWVLAEFKSGRSPIMLATDVASRGLGMLPSSSTFFRKAALPPKVGSGLITPKAQHRLGLFWRNDALSKRLVCHLQ